MNSKYFQSVFESANVGKSITLPSGEIFVNKAFCDLLGYSKEELQNTKWQDITPKEEIEKINELLSPLFEGKKDAIRFEKRYIHKNGSFVWADVSIALKKDTRNIPEYLITTVVDISRQKMAEGAIEESEKRYRNILELAPVGISIHQNGVIVYSNPESLKIFGANNPNELIGQNVTRVIPKENLIKFEKRIKGLHQGEAGHYPIEDKYIKLDGTEIDVEVYANLLTWNNKPAIQGIITDITEKKKIRKELEDLNIQLEDRIIERTSQLEATNKELESFSYSVSHDLRAPLRHINGYVNLLTELLKNRLDEKEQHYFGTITDAAKQMGALIDDLLQFSRTGRQILRIEKYDMNTIVNEALTRLSSAVENRNIEFVISKLPVVRCDNALMTQVWVNLIDNAIKYTGRKDKAIIEIGFEREKSKYIFHIKDNGVGFDMQYSHKLFGVFQRLHLQTEFEGTGIGLANVQKIILKHGGNVWAAAQPDLGATFYFAIPK